MQYFNSSLETFWNLVDQTKMSEKYRIDKNLQYLKAAPLDILKKIFVHYRYFTHYYIQDMAILISKMPFGNLRSILGEILNDELGNGNSKASHPILYDRFLQSIEINSSEMNYTSQEYLPYLTSVQNSLLEKSWIYGVGLRGMGGECLCQIYLTTMYDYFSENPAIKKIKNKIDWQFWDIHIGEIDLHHQKIVKQAISEIILEYPENNEDLFSGYLESKTAWDGFWLDIFNAAIYSRSANENRAIG